MNGATLRNATGLFLSFAAVYVLACVLLPASKPVEVSSPVQQQPTQPVFVPQVAGRVYH